MDGSVDLDDDARSEFSPDRNGEEEMGSLIGPMVRSSSQPELAGLGSRSRSASRSPLRMTPKMVPREESDGGRPNLSVSLSMPAFDELADINTDKEMHMKMMQEMTEPGARMGTVTSYFAQELRETEASKEESKSLLEDTMVPSRLPPGVLHWSELDFYHLAPDGACQRRRLSRLEILAEANKGFESLIPSAKKLGKLVSSLDTIPELKALQRKMGVSGGKQERGLLKQFLRSAVQLRDIRQLDPAFSSKTALWVRHSACIISMEGIRALITHESMFVFDPDSEKTAKALPILRQRLHSEDSAEDAFMPFEFRAIEGILIVVVMRLEQDFIKLEPNLSGCLRELPKQLTSSLLEELRTNQVRLNHYRARLENVQNGISELLDDDEDMSKMYLTEKHRNPSVARNPIDHDEVEALLESYLQVIDDLSSRAALLDLAIEDTEDLVGIHLDTLRNKLLMVQLTLAVFGMMLTFGALVGKMRLHPDSRFAE